MRKYIDENDKKNEIRLLFNHSSYKGKVVCIVEGQSDLQLFRKLLPHDDLKIESVDGKKCVVKIMKELSVEFPHQILAVCDADYEHLEKTADDYKHFSVFVTDYHDVETLMINSPSLTNFIQEHTVNDKVNLLCDELYDKVMETAYSIGLLRWINHSEKLKLKFKGLNFNKFIDVTDFTINLNLDVLLNSLLQQSTKKLESVTKEFLKNKLVEYKLQGGCKLQVCCGHDLTNIISIVYRNKWASHYTDMNSNKVKSGLRIGYQHEFFADTRLAKELKGFLSNYNIELTRC